MFRTLLFSLFAVCFILSQAQAQNEVFGKRFTLNQEPELLTFDELKYLSENPRPQGPLQDKLDRLFNTVFINNEAFYAGAKPNHPKHDQLGPVLRVASWNIEKSLNLDKAIQLFSDPDYAFDLTLAPEEVTLGSDKHAKIKEQRARIQEADILVLQEMEIGIKRSQYRHATRDLAKALDMNYAFATQYLEVDPAILGIEKLKYEDGEMDDVAMEYYQVDPGRFKGVFGSAVLSRYPIKYSEVRPLIHQPYDWYDGEKVKTTFLENTRRFGSKIIFENELTREMKVGGRHYFRIDLHVPQLPKETLTIINVHLEIKCLPKGRRAQMQEILSYIINIDNPLILIGDLNAAPTDISPTSAWRVTKRVAKNPTTWLNAAVNYVSPYGLAINTSRGVSNITKNFNDPLATDIKVVAPNKVKPMFNDIKNFRFSDGSVFDFRGDGERSVGGKEKILSNSNQRGRKGFRTTFSVKRPLIGVIGKYRLDWTFVKVHMNDPESKSGPYKFAPHFGETLEELNSSLRTPVSDHHPNVVDIPLVEPVI